MGHKKSLRIRPHPAWLLARMYDNGDIDDGVSDKCSEQASDNEESLDNALLLAKLNARCVRELDSGVALMSLLEIVQDVLLNHASRGL